MSNNSKRNNSDNMRTGSVLVELTHVSKGYARVIKDTLALFRAVCAFLIHVACDNISDIHGLSSYEQLTLMEQLVHETKENPSPKYVLFDKLFYKLPSYIRRAAIHASCGHVTSHETRCDTYYEERDEKVKRGWHYKKMEPAFTYTPNVFPTLYKKETFKLEDNTISIKVFINNTWNWITFSIPNRDYKSLKKAMSLGTLKNPKLVYQYHKFYLQFPVVYDTKKFSELPLDEQRVLSVDRGLNHGAVCSVVDAYGTVHERFFDPFKSDMDRIDYIINRIRKIQKTSGKDAKLSALYTKLMGLKDNCVKQLSRWIVNRAIEQKVYGIVLEHLESIKRKDKKRRGSLKARTHHWETAKMRDYIKGMAFREGIRVFIVNPKGTSMYAYDGSGKVKRDEENYSLCTFANGKQYNCDLSASYNIGARYFLRAFQKSISATKWLELKAKVPELSKRTSWTLNTLRELRKFLPACA